jgi:hypothetical protein
MLGYLPEDKDINDDDDDDDKVNKLQWPMEPLKTKIFDLLHSMNIPSLALRHPELIYDIILSILQLSIDYHEKLKDYNMKKKSEDDSGDGNDEYDDALVNEAVGNDLTQEITSIEAAAYEEGLDLDIRDIYYCNEDHHLDEQEQSNFASMQQESRMVGTEEDRIESDSLHSFKLDISSFRTRTSNELIAIITPEMSLSRLIF